MALYDIDAMAEKFEPVRVKFRGKEYGLGENVHSILTATTMLQGKVDPKASEKDTTLAVFTELRPILRVLSPALADAIDADGLNAAEEAAMLRPVTEVLSQVGKLSFPAAE